MIFILDLSEYIYIKFSLPYMVLLLVDASIDDAIFYIYEGESHNI